MTDAALSYFHRGGDTSLLGRTISEHFAQVCREHGDREAGARSAGAAGWQMCDGDGREPHIASADRMSPNLFGESFKGGLQLSARRW